MKRNFKLFAVPFLILLLIPCMALFSGCGANTYSTSDFYAYYETEEEVDSEDYELYEELESGAIYKYIFSEERTMSVSFTILTENTYKLSMNQTETSGPATISTEAYLDGIFEQYENGYILTAGIEEPSYFYVEVDASLLVGFTCLRSSETIEAAREAVDNYVESGDSFIVYFGYNCEF